MAVTEIVVMNVHVQILCEYVFSVLLGPYLGVDLLGYTVSVFNIGKNCVMFPCDCIFYIPTISDANRLDNELADRT